MASAVVTTMKRATKIIRPKSKKSVDEKNNTVLTASLSESACASEQYKMEAREASEASEAAEAEMAKVKSTDTCIDNDTQIDEEVKAYCDPELFVKRQIRRTISVAFYKITKSVIVAHLLRTELAKMVEGKCSIEGYICPNSISIRSYSCGTLSGANIHFDVVADCLICFPDENSVIKCVAKTITQAGIRAGARYLEAGNVSPIEVFLSRDMHASSRELFSRVEENDVLTVKIIGRRFVLHDTHVTIIAMLLDAENP